MEKLGKREAKRQLKLLCGVCNGITPSMKYDQLKKAKNFAKIQGLEFPAESQRELTKAAKQVLGLAIAFQLGNGSYK